MTLLGARSLVSSQTRWRMPEDPQERAQQIASELGVSLALARVVAGRVNGTGYAGLLSNELGDLQSPFLMEGMEQAVVRIGEAIERGERLFIHGDFDVDGLTSSAMLYRTLRQLGAAHVELEIGDRERGHGLSPETAEVLAARRIDLLITTDCGISDVEAVRSLRERGIDVIITDHHHPPEVLPPAQVIINPRRDECAYPNMDLAAVGVIYQFVSALFERLGPGAEAARAHLDLAMLGTVGDLVPLVTRDSYENRILVKGGLDLLAQGGGCTGVRVLLERLSLDPTKLSAGQISYVLIPKLNAANRVGDPRVASLLLTTEDEAQAGYLADVLIEYNRDRQLAQESMRTEAEQLLERDIDLDRDRLILLDQFDWNPGVIGLVASDLVDEHHLPTILLSRGPAASRASARSIPEFNMIEALAAHERFFTRYGGHRMAAGFSIENGRIAALKEALGEYARERLGDLGGPTRSIDAELGSEEVSFELYQELRRLGPFGMGNRAPRFLLRGCRVCQARAVGADGRHLKLKLEAGTHELNAIGFGMGEALTDVSRAALIDVVFRLSRDDWNGRSAVQLGLEDVLASQMVADSPDQA